MAIINYTDQLKYTGKGYLDAKMMPVETVDDLKKISLTQRFEGLTITVLLAVTPVAETVCDLEDHQAEVRVAVVVEYLSSTYFLVAGL